jgi:hypothetical protein
VEVKSTAPPPSLPGRANSFLARPSFAAGAVFYFTDCALLYNISFRFAYFMHYVWTLAMSMASGEPGMHNLNSGRSDAEIRDPENLNFLL